MAVSTLHAAPRPRAYVSVKGPDAASYLNRMVSNDVESLAVGDSCEALLLTPKARIVAPLVAWRRGENDFLLLSEPDAEAALVRALLRARFAADCAIEAESHSSVVVLGAEGELQSSRQEPALPNRDYGVPAVELLDTDPPDDAERMPEEELERLRIWFDGLEVEPVVAQLHRRAEDIRAAEIAVRRHRFPAHLHEELENLTRSIVRKILHHPSAQLRDGAEAASLHHLAALKDLFRLDEESPAPQPGMGHDDPGRPKS